MNIKEVKKSIDEKRKAKKMKFSESTTTIHMDREVADFARDKAKKAGISLKQYLEDCVIFFEEKQNPLNNVLKNTFNKGE